MYSWKPDLLEILRPRCGGLALWPPKIRSEEGSSLVKRNRMPSVRYVRVICGERKSHRILDPPNRTDRIPYADEVRFAEPRRVEGLFEFACQMEIRTALCAF